MNKTERVITVILWIVLVTGEKCHREDWKENTLDWARKQILELIDEDRKGRKNEAQAH